MSEWKEYKLGEIYEVHNGLSKGREFFGSGFPFISFSTVFNKWFIPETITDLAQTTEAEQESYSIKAGDILVTRTSETADELGMSCVALRDIPHATYNGFCKRMRHYNTEIKVAPKYIGYYMRNPEFRKRFQAFSGSMSTRASLTNEDLLSLTVKLPPLAEQKRIAEILGSLDDKIELNNRINRNLEEQAQALFKNWFVDFEPFGGVMPEEWKEESLADLCGSISKVHKFDKKDLIFLNTGDVDHGQYLHRTYSLVKDMPGQAKKSIQKNDILYSEIRPANGHYAYVNFNAEDYVVSTKLMVIRAKEISSYRLYNYLTNPDVIAELQTEADARSGTFPQIRFENIQRLSMVIGSKEVETRFSKLLENLYKQIFANIEENQKLIDLRDTLLPKLMSEEEI